MLSMPQASPLPGCVHPVDEVRVWEVRAGAQQSQTHLKKPGTSFTPASGHKRSAEIVCALQRRAVIL